MATLKGKFEQVSEELAVTKAKLEHVEGEHAAMVEKYDLLVKSLTSIIPN